MAEVKFNKKKIELTEHDFGTTNTEITFPSKIKIPPNRIEYGEDYASIGKDLVILNYKLKGKDKIITSITIIGHSQK